MTAAHALLELGQIASAFEPDAPHIGQKPQGCGLSKYTSAVLSNLERRMGTAMCLWNAGTLADRPKPKGVNVLVPDVAAKIAVQVLLELSHKARLRLERIVKQANMLRMTHLTSRYAGYLEPQTYDRQVTACGTPSPYDHILSVDFGILYPLDE
ncbi:hypothetical protein MTO96_038821 [Rhipicephalus appendiculatus]